VTPEARRRFADDARGRVRDDRTMKLLLSCLVAASALEPFIRPAPGGAAVGFRF
jgi:hypothetical protein